MIGRRSPNGAPRRERRAQVLLGGLLLAGCGAADTGGPSVPVDRGVTAYTEAVRKGQPKQAYAMLSKAVRATLPYGEFAAAWDSHDLEREAQAKALEAALRDGRDLGQRATVTVGGGAEASLRYQAGRWRLEAPLISPGLAPTPQLAVKQFSAALAARSYDDTLALLSSRRRLAIGRRLDTFSRSLADAIEGPGKNVHLLADDRAELQWADGDTLYKISLTLEGGSWHIDEVYVWPTSAPDEPKDEGDGEEDGERGELDDPGGIFPGL